MHAILQLTSPCTKRKAIEIQLKSILDSIRSISDKSIKIQSLKLKKSMKYS